MSLTNPNKPVTEARLQEFYHRIKSYLGFTKMPSEDMSEVISPLPSIQPRYHKYSTEEHIVGEWIDGSKIYEKTVEATVPTQTSSGADNTLDLTSLSINTLIECKSSSSTIESMPISPYLSSSTGIPACIQVFYNTSNKKLYIRNRGLAVDNGKTIYVTLTYTKSE